MDYKKARILDVCNLEPESDIIFEFDISFPDDIE